MIYHVFANRSNIGDWLSARAIQALLGQPVVELLCDEPFVPETLDRLSGAGGNDLVVIGGGGLLMDYFAPFWTGFEPLSSRIPFCLWGVGCCDMKRASSVPDAALLKRIVSRSRLCVVRDDLTRAFLSDSPLPAAVACPAFTIVDERPAGHGILHVDALDNVGDDIYESMSAIGRRFAAETGRPFSATNNEIPAGNERALTSVLRQYGNADLILTGRLHGCIIGLAMGRKVLAVSGDRKIESFMHAAGLDEWVLGLETSDRIAERLKALTQQRASVDFVRSARQANRDVAGAVHAITRNISQLPAACEDGRRSHVADW
jgi:polysaccharide pyruvyl transferase WcaK-like protein